MIILPLYAFIKFAIASAASQYIFPSYSSKWKSHPQDSRPPELLWGIPDLPIAIGIFEKPDNVNYFAAIWAFLIVLKLSVISNCTSI